MIAADFVSFRHIPCVCLLVLLLTVGYAGAEPLRLSDTYDHYRADNHLSYLEDVDKSLTIETILESGLQKKFTRAADWASQIGSSNSAAWLHLSVISADEYTKKWWLEIGNPLLDRIDIYIVKEDNTIRNIQMGDNFPMADRDIRVRNPLLPITLKHREKVDIFLRIQTYGPLSAPIHLWEPKVFTAKAIDRQLGYGIFYGIFLALFLYNLILYFSVRDLNYLFYCGLVISLVIWRTSINGLGYEYLWPGNINIYIALLFSKLYAICLLSFAIFFLRIRRLYPLLYKVLLVFMGISPLILAIFIFFDKAAAVRLLPPYSKLSIALTLFAGIYAYRHGVREAKYFCVAMLFIATASVIQMVAGVWSLTANDWVPQLRRIGWVAEAILFSCALTHKMRLTMLDNERIEQENKEKLEKKVIERTEALMTATGELEAANQQLQEISINDGLTGIKNRLYFEQAFNREFLRCRREHKPLSILMIDIDYFKRINDAYGHICGDQALRFVAQSITDSVRRPGDIVARFGGEEFIVTLPETNYASAQFVAERIRRSIGDSDFCFCGDSIKLTASIGYAVLDPSQADQKPEDLINAADKALYAAKHGGRNQVVAA